MTAPNDLEPAGIWPVDYARACRILIGVAPGRTDQHVINAVLAEIESDERVSQCIVAIAELTHLLDKNLRGDDGIEALRLMTANMTRDQEWRDR